MKSLQRHLWLIFACTLVIHWSSLGWRVGPVGPTLLLTVAGIAGWTLQGEGVVFVSVFTFAFFYALSIFPEQGQFLETVRATCAVAAMAQLAATAKGIVYLHQSVTGQDALTGLLNQTRFSELLHVQEQRRSLSSGELSAIAFLDCDQFKGLNDTAGHLVGDQYLKAVASQLTGILFNNEFAGRWGGDEFVLYLLGPDQETIQNRLEQLQQSLIAPLTDHSIELSWSIGLGIFFQSGHAQEMIDFADRAMYVSKRSGEGQVYVVTHSGSDAV